MSSPTLFPGQAVDLAALTPRVASMPAAAPAPRWLASHVVSEPSPEGTVVLAWPMDTDGFLPVLRVGTYDWVLDALDRGQTRVEFASLAASSMGAYQHQGNVILIANAVQDVSVDVLAAILVHEATHLSDAQHARWSGSAAECLRFEERAFANEAAFWRAVFGPRGKADPVDEWEQSLNELLRDQTFDRAAARQQVHSAYAEECGG
jgi:hypothetical protein